MAIYEMHERMATEKKYDFFSCAPVKSSPIVIAHDLPSFFFSARISCLLIFQFFFSSF